MEQCGQEKQGARDHFEIVTLIIAIE